MKNIHILKTDKPSRLLKDIVDETYQFKKVGLYGNRFEVPLNIYITSDEEIKEGNWFLPQGHINPHKLKGYNKINGDLESYNGLCYDISKCKKIILTTDQELINDGVQAIPDEFLKWFVKNPSCEEVGVVFSYKSVNELPIGYHRIVIPKEKPKQDSIYKCTCLRPQVNCFSGMCSYCNRQIVKNLTTEDLKPKIVGEYQEELFNYLHDLGVTALQSEMQEVERIVLGMQQENSNINALHFEIDALKREIKALKHQQEQDKNKYSEEDMIEASKYGYNFHKTTQFPNQEFEDSCIRNTQQWVQYLKRNNYEI